MWYVRPAKPQITQSDQSLCLSLDYSVTVKLLTEHHMEFLSLNGGCTGWFESTLVNMPHCWKSHIASNILRESRVIISKLYSTSVPEDCFYLSKLCKP